MGMTATVDYKLNSKTLQWIRCSSCASIQELVWIQVLTQETSLILPQSQHIFLNCQITLFFIFYTIVTIMLLQ